MRCEGCGDRFELSVRGVQRYRAEGREPRCAICRRPHTPLTTEERSRFKLWWIEESGLSISELRELALGLGFG